MNPIETFLEQHTYIRSRLIGLLKEIEDSGKAEEALYWKLPYGEKGRAHIHWQVLHCAATLDRYLNVRVLKQNPKNEKLVAGFAGICSGYRKQNSAEFSQRNSFRNI